MILNDIKEKLEQIDQNVFYGMVSSSVRESVWDYIVFDRKRVKTPTNKTGYSYYFGVHIIRENFIPEGLEISVIDKMLEIPGMRLAGTDPTFEYVPKPNTDNVVEMLSIEFVRPIKG